jgi:hypothetical protein
MRPCSGSYVPVWRERCCLSTLCNERDPLRHRHDEKCRVNATLERLERAHYIPRTALANTVVRFFRRPLCVHTWKTRVRGPRCRDCTIHAWRPKVVKLRGLSACFGQCDERQFQRTRLKLTVVRLFILIRLHNLGIHARNPSYRGQDRYLSPENCTVDQVSMLLLTCLPDHVVKSAMA